MAKLIIIAAVGKNYELGKDNDLIWHLKEDLMFFKEVTLGHKIVMGYKTFESLPKILENRDHIVLTHKNLGLDSIKVFNDFQTLKNYLKDFDEEVYIIGGASIYKLFIDYADEIILTEIDAECIDADIYFPKFNKDEFERILIKEVAEKDFLYKHIRYRRKLK